MNLSSTIRSFGTALLVLACAAIASAQSEKILSLNNAAGVSATLEDTPTRTLSVVQGAGNTTDGDGALRLQGVSTQRDGNRYFGIMVPLGRSWDLTKARLAVDARNSEPGNTGAFYVRAYNRGERIDLQIYAYDGATGKELWQFETVHPSRSGAITDLDGDGKQEVIAGTHYYTASVLSHDGKRVWSYRLGPISYDIATGNFDGNKTRGVVIGAGDGLIHYTDSKGEARLKFNTGDEVKQVATMDLDGDGKDEILAASENSYLYCFGADSKTRWLRYLTTPASTLAAARIGTTPVVLGGTRSGELLAFDAKGELLRWSSLQSAITQLSMVDGATIITTEDGRLMRLDF